MGEIELSTIRSSATILAANDYWKESDWDAAKALLDGYTPSGTFVSPYSFVFSKNTDVGVDYYSASNAFQTIYGGATLANHHIGGVDGADVSAVIQAVANAMPSGSIICFKNATYTLNTIVDFTKDVKVICEPGTILKWAGGNTCMFYNSVPIHLRWLGGIIDQDSVGDNTLGGSCYVWGFGGYAAGVPITTGQGDSHLLSCIVDDVEFRNIRGGAWIANQVGAGGTDFNTNMTFRNLIASKCVDSSVYDMFQCVGQNVTVKNMIVNLENAPINNFAWTSAWIKNGDIEVYVVDDNNQFSTHRNIALEVYDSNGDYPNIEHVKITANGQILFINGNVDVISKVGQDIWVNCVNANMVHLGAGDYDQWQDIRITGFLKSIPGAVLDKTISLGHIINAELDITIDAEDLTAVEGALGIITIEGSILTDNIHFSRLVVKNAVAGSALGIIAAGPGALCGDWIIDGGDITQNVGISLFHTTHAFNYFGQGAGKVTLVNNLRGYVTENNGYVTFVNETLKDDIAHGLVGTPTHVLITPQDQTTQLWYATPTATTFDIHAATNSSGVVHWKAFYQPNP
jgi:hypothetical protein